MIPDPPLVILSSSPKVADKVLLETGADDCVTIPFSPRELGARVDALIRRVSRFSPDDADVYEHPEAKAETGERPFAPVALSHSTRPGL